MGRGQAARRVGVGGLAPGVREHLGVGPGEDVFGPVTIGLRGNQFAHVLIDLSTGQVMVMGWPGRQAFGDLWRRYHPNIPYANAYTAAIELRRYGNQFVYSLVDISRAAAEVTLTPGIRQRIIQYLRRSGARGIFQWFEDGKKRTATIG